MSSKVNPPLEIVIIVSSDNLSVEQTPKQKELITKLSWPTTTLSHLEQQWLDFINDPNNFKSNLPKVDFIVGSEVENQDEYGTRIKVRVGELEGYVAKKYIFETEEDGEWYLLSTSTTKAGANTNRDININIASSYINGKILQPNEKFSFWDTVGKCTYDKGYKDATVYNNGKKTKGIGGGVCQVSTTVNMAVKSAGIKTNARQHSLPVSYASREDEATVSFGNIDFKFTNTTGKTIMLVMGAVDGSCTCEVWAKYE